MLKELKQTIDNIYPFMVGTGLGAISVFGVIAALEYVTGSPPNSITLIESGWSGCYDSIDLEAGTWEKECYNLYCSDTGKAVEIFENGTMTTKEDLYNEFECR